MGLLQHNTHGHMSFTGFSPAAFHNILQSSAPADSAAVAGTQKQNPQLATAQRLQHNSLQPPVNSPTYISLIPKK